MKHVLVVCLLLVNGLFANVPEIPISDININNWQVIKKNKEHTVYFCNHEYMKIWKKKSWHFRKKQHDIFLNAAKSGFLEGISPLKAIIMQSDQCVGYITDACDPICDFTFRVVNIKDLRKSSNIPNYHLVVNLFRLYKHKILSTGFCFFGDFRRSSNMGRIGDNCYFFDLDRIAILSEYQDKRPEHSAKMLFVLDGDF